MRIPKSVDEYERICCKRFRTEVYVHEVYDCEIEDDDRLVNDLHG